MIYDKLPVVLLSTLATCSEGDTNYVIASYILNHVDDVKALGIKDLAKRCHVGTGSISRFCREIGLDSFTELKNSLNVLISYDESHYASDSLSDHIQQAIALTAQSVDQTRISQLVNDLKTHRTIYAFGLLKAQNAATDFVVDMRMLNVEVKTAVAYGHQIDIIKHAGEGDLILIFSYTGSYFDTHIWRQERIQLKQATIWMIMSGNHEIPPFVRHVIRFESLQDQRSHPYQLEYIANLITETYAKGEE